MNIVNYYNIKLNNTNTVETISICQKFLISNTNNLIFFINAHCFNIAQKNSIYKEALNSADLLLNDGIGIKLGALLSGIKIKENMNGTDFIPKLIRLAKDLNKNIYLLGGEEGVAISAKGKLQEMFKGISIIGTNNGFFDFENDQTIISDIIDKKTEILIVGMGVPRQELWLLKNKNKLKGVKLSIAGGAVLDFISRKVNRAPIWMQKTGIEWIYRLVQEPKRLFKRYFIGIPLFFYYLIKFK